MSLAVRNPFNGELVCELPYDEGDALAGKVDRARETQRSWRGLSLPERIARVREGLDRFRSAGEEIARNVTLQMGKPLVQARREVETVFERADYMISIAEESLSPDILPEKAGFHRRIEHEPLGVVLNMAAWNYPLIIPVNVIVPALLAGNTVLLKHSARTPLSGMAYQDSFGDLVTNLVLTHEETARLISHPGIAHVSFTGSVEGGREVHRNTANRFIDAGLELGGNDPAYVAEDAEIDFAVDNIVDGACYNAGQSCCAVERVYVHRKQYDAFLEKALPLLEAYRPGDPLEEETTLGPLANASALEWLEGQVKDAVDRGADLLLGGKRGDGNFFPPTLLAGVPNDASVMQEESFGPVVPVLAVENDEEAIRHMNDTRFGLTASVWTKDRDRAERFAREVEAGTILQNRCDVLDPALPWTGWGDSGKGSTLSPYGFLPLTRRKAIHFRFHP